MKILVTSDVFPPDIGGPATFVPVLATALAERGHEVTVITWSRLARHAEDDRYVFGLERIPRGRWRTLRLARLLPRLLVRARRADVVFVNGLLFPAWVVDGLARRPMVAKVVGDLAWEYAQAQGVGDDLERFTHRRYRASVEWRRRLRAAALRAMDAVVVPSEYLAGLVKSWGVEPGRVHVIANAFGVREAPAGPGDPSAASGGPRHGPRRLVTVGRLVPHKHVGGIIDVLPALIDVELLVIGDGPERTSLVARARALGCDRRVIFTGSLPPGEVSARLREAEVFVLNSRYEGLPHVVLEAFAAGLPVVATAAGGTPELVRDGESGLLVPIGLAAPLREAIRAVLDDGVLRERLIRGGRSVLARHSLPGMVDMTEALLARVSGRQPARPRLCFVLPELDDDADSHFAHTVRSLEILARSVELDVIVQHARHEPRIAGARRVLVQTARARPLRLLQLARFLLASWGRGGRTVYVHYSYSGAIVAGLLGRLGGARLHYWHCGQVKQFYPRWGWSWRTVVTKLGDEFLLRLALRLTHRLVTGTPRMAAYYAREFGVPREKISVVPNDIDLARFRDHPHRVAARAELGLPLTGPVVLFVHRLAPRKGVHHIVPTAERVGAAVPDVVFLVVGGGPMAEALAREVRARQLADTVRLVGPVPNRRIALYYAAADVFFMPSDEEGFPRVLLEAQAAGVPFVATDVGGVLDLVTPRQAEFIVPRGMVDALADRLTRLLKDAGLRQALADEGAKNVAEFDVHPVAGRLLAALFPPA